MLKTLKKTAIAITAGSLLVVTTVIGAVAGAAGAVMRAQMPDAEEPQGTSQTSAPQDTAMFPKSGKPVTGLPSKEKR